MAKTTPKFKVGGSHDPQQTSLTSRFGSNGHEGNRREFQWDDTLGVLLIETVTKVCRSGDAVMFGVTRDGGCGVISLLSGDERKRFYPSDRESTEQALMQINYAYSTSSERVDFPADFNPLGGRK